MESLQQRKEQIQHHAQIQKKHDTKKLYKIINDMTSGKTLNPIPLNKTDEELGNKFAKYFLHKIEKIRSKLTAVNPFACIASESIQMLKPHSV